MVSHYGCFLDTIVQTQPDCGRAIEHAVQTHGLVIELDTHEANTLRGGIQPIVIAKILKEV